MKNTQENSALRAIMILQMDTNVGVLDEKVLSLTDFPVRMRICENISRIRNDMYSV